ncbi:hypothetical protein [Microcoleus sp. PH2017_05_CCC_O_A]|uniref:hypothetical protein n=1 Tax=Microcoleus sp. PH2017_05_CCC_O_A TaxID=2798816 RepID=UPI0025D84A83|nr:hypothetical protein [Microcoleus sp. PH2017_05_CCC_O_A]
MRLLKYWRLVLLALVFGMAVIVSNCGTPANISNNSPTATTPAAVPPGAFR